MSKYEFLNKYAETVRVEEDELEKYEDDSSWWLMGEVQSPKDDDPTPEAESEELQKGVQALRDFAERNNSPLWDELADDYVEEKGLQESSNPESTGSIRESESWSDYKQRMRDEGVSVGNIDSKTERELRELKKGSRLRVGKGHSSTALNEHLEEKASRLLDEADDSHPSDKLKDEKGVTSEMAQKAAESFRKRAEESGKDYWKDIASTYDEFAESEVEVETFPDLGDTRLTHHTDGSCTIQTSHSELKEELQGLMVYGNQDDPVCHQVSYIDDELTVEIDDPDQAIEELERVM